MQLSMKILRNHTTIMGQSAESYYNPGTIRGIILQSWDNPRNYTTILRQSEESYYNHGTIWGIIPQSWDNQRNNTTIMGQSLESYYNHGTNWGIILQSLTIWGIILQSCDNLRNHTTIMEQSEESCCNRGTIWGIILQSWDNLRKQKIPSQSLQYIFYVCLYISICFYIEYKIRSNYHRLSNYNFSLMLIKAIGVILIWLSFDVLLLENKNGNILKQATIFEHIFNGFQFIFDAVHHQRFYETVIIWFILIIDQNDTIRLHSFDNR